jgi:hypothetical protein
MTRQTVYQKTSKPDNQIDRKPDEPMKNLCLYSGSSFELKPLEPAFGKAFRVKYLSVTLKGRNVGSSCPHE